MGDGVPPWWFIYESGWINVWFYDDPFDDTRYKDITITIDVAQFEDGPSSLTFAVNWSGADWSLIGNPPGADRVPPIEDADDIPAYLGRETLLEVVDVMLPPFETPDRYVFTWNMPDFNPEWVSIDVMGTNFIVDGWAWDEAPELGIDHECLHPCPWDLSGDGVVTPFDVGFVKARYGCDPIGMPYDPLCRQADLSGDGAVTPFDVGFVKSNYGPCP